ncbi:MAG: hypothetical protein CL678_14345 [Bdellovibrionaceae bacterium]|nr:hypothetical protein [Pseudobdellovibrionaceae bacterium]
MNQNDLDIQNKILDTIKNKTDFKDSTEIDMIRYGKDPNSESYLVTVNDKINDKIIKEFDEEQEQSRPYRSSPKLRPAFSKTGTLDIEFLFENAKILVKAKDFDLARNIYNAIIKNGSHSAEGLFGIAITYEGEKDYEKALSYYEESAAYHPSFKTFKRLCSVLQRLGRWTYAAETYERALLLKNVENEDQVYLHFRAAECWQKAERFTEAEIHYKQVTKIAPKDSRSYNALGSLEMSRNRVPEALEYFKKGSQIHSEDASSYFGMGSCYLSLGKRLQAMDSFAKSLERNIQNPTAIFYLVRLGFELKLYEKAEKLVQKYVNQAPINPNLLYSLAAMQYHIHHYEDSLKNIQKLLQMRAEHEGAKKLKKLVLKKMN